MRYFLLDRVTEFVPGKLARGVKCVTLTDETLHDHFPDHPVLPGALLIEACAQLAGYLLEESHNLPGVKPRRALMAQVDKAKFYETCGPGDRIEITATLAAKQDEAAQVTMEAQVDGRRVMRGQLTFFMKTIASRRLHAQRRYLYRLWTKDPKKS